MKFTIRDLFLVTVIVALVLGWWIDHRRAGAEKAAVEEDASYMADFLFGYFSAYFEPSDRLNELQRRYRYPGSPGKYLRRDGTPEQGRLLP